MSQRTNTYNYLYLEYGDKWYPLFDKQNMLTTENQLQALFKFVAIVTFKIQTIKLSLLF